MDEAKRLDLVQKVVDDADAEAEVQVLVRRLIQLPSTAYKSLLIMGRSPELATWLDRELDSFLACSTTEVFHHRVEAFARGGRG
jgi:enoyl-CoA hydratase/carnithine racemase